MYFFKFGNSTGVKRAKRGLLGLCLAGLCMVLSGCGGSSEGEGALVVGTEATYPPFEMTDDAGNIIGFDIDLLKAVARATGLEVEFRDMDFDSLVPAIQGGNIDIGASGMSITPLRLKQIDFSDPYIEAGLVVAVGGSSQGITGVDDLKGKRVAVQQGTTGAAKSEELLAAGKIGSLKYFPNVSVAMMELLNGAVDAVINDKPVTQAFVAKHPGKIKIVGGTLASDEYGFAIAKGREELLSQINEGLRLVKESGEFDALIAKYFSSAEE
ncbi:basic amino acid ABC transporter substrate-binding protein [Pelagicoccus albus]|uniref:Basic amino acid ABC transporter substrate-binding protein n=1 Tax=Pelagicoccus albus TaxID=415222 RepID=A0A7X1B978_9BACT|nr:basic amino acid ABC transporter substrate-binding protein [Pelagicoccus albus]MBC2606718.1 basic amino acid ABC transporter substrate-binding protein [Pelagicoccus albus]